MSDKIYTVFEKLVQSPLHFFTRRWTRPFEMRKDFLFLLSEKNHPPNSREIADGLKLIGRTLPEPCDWCCVHNFQAESRPRVIALPAGKGIRFRSDMECFIVEVRQRLRKILLSDHFQKKVHLLRLSYDKQEQAAVRPLYQSMGKNSLHDRTKPQVSNHPSLKSFAEPVVAYSGIGRTSGNAVAFFDQPLPVDYRLIRDRIRSLKKRCNEELDAFTKDKANEAVFPLMAKLRKKYRKMPKVLVYLEDVEEDILRNLHIFTLPADETSLSRFGDDEKSSSREGLYSPYTVNVLISRVSKKYRPLVFAGDAAFEDLFGRSGTACPKSLPHSRVDFAKAKAGALHEANGGILVLEASWILRQFHLWELLKNAVSQKELRFTHTVAQAGIFASKSADPGMITLNATIIITGTSCEFSILSFIDPDFPYVVGGPCKREDLAAGRIPKEPFFDKMRTLNSKKFFHISARQAILTLCSHPQFLKADFESHLMKLLFVIELGQDYSDSRLVTAEHIGKALKQTYPETADLIDTVIPGRRTIRRYMTNGKNYHPEEIIETLKPLTGKVNIYGKQT